MPFDLQFTKRFLEQFSRLPEEIKKPARKAVQLLAINPRHSSLQTHKVAGGRGDYGGDVFEAYMTMKYRMTWEYGPGKKEITLRNIDNHDECLEEP